MRVENGKKILSVSEVNTYIGNIIKQDYLLKNVCLEGEVSSLSKGPTGHLYITLKDCTAPEGQNSTHRPQATHFSFSTWAT